MNKSELIEAVAADSGLCQSRLGRVAGVGPRHRHEDAEKRRRGDHHRLRQVLRRQTRRASGCQPADGRARENQSLEGAEVQRGRDVEAGGERQEIRVEPPR